MATITAVAAGGVSITAFLDTLRWSEGTSDSPITKADGYDVIVTGVDGPEIFTDYSQHPFVNRPAKLVIAPCARFPNGLRSSASGGYQLLEKYWIPYKTMLDLPDFSPLSQDKIAIQQMKERGSLIHLQSGAFEQAITAHLTPPEVDLEDAIEEDSAIWASLPGNTYGQGGHSMEAIIEKFEDFWSRSFISA